MGKGLISMSYDGARQGMVCVVQRCSVHDGPGLRTTVFLKGCNLSCAWCHNPETISPEPEWMVNADQCIECGCCSQGCFSGARELCGTERTVEDVLAEVLLDRHYYKPEGGLTISGGEPMCQPDFTKELLQAAQCRGIHTAIETNISVAWPTVKSIVRHCDLVMVDLKIWDRELHKKWTGQTNDLVKENIEKLSSLTVPVVLRTPVIQDINDTPEEIVNTAKFASRVKNLLYYELLPYHPLGLSKGTAGGIPTTNFSTPANRDMQRLGEQAASEGIPVRIGGRVVQVVS